MFIKKNTIVGGIPCEMSIYTSSNGKRVNLPFGMKCFSEDEVNPLLSLLGLDADYDDDDEVITGNCGIFDYEFHKPKKDVPSEPVRIEKVIFNARGTVILWSDGDKTLAVCDKWDTFDKKIGFLVAWGKKNAIKEEKLIDAIDKWCPEVFDRKEDIKKEQKKGTSSLKIKRK